MNIVQALELMGVDLRQVRIEDRQDGQGQRLVGWYVPNAPQPTSAELTASLQDPALWRRKRLGELAAKRYAVETAGITVAGVAVATDRQSQAMLTGAWVRVQQEPAALIDWKGENGWVQIDKATVEALAAAVGGHVQACFSVERSHSEALAALATTGEIEAYDITAGWPQ